jgi:DNA-binding GntR family transcriptional regulator
VASRSSFSRPQTISHEVYEHLRTEVLQGNLLPGQWLREQEIAATLNVSRTPVREALRRLDQEGLLEISPNRGVRVRELSAAEAVETYEVRALLEARAARSAAQRASHDDVNRLRALLDAIAELPPEDYAAHIGADDAFHNAIADVAGNEVLSEMIRLLNSRITYLKIVTRDTNAGVTTARQHAAIVEAIEARDPDAAEAAMRTHVDTYQGVVKERIDAGFR